ncbi:DMT family transporter [Actomonas aquatica]|uniref:DMT family transporter n=1 Tax=Actomonas aquatica TaxID=2866162 RepID=A0ABZ1C2P7_9BACT|nr:DMT family transporter [Opitutus sp. WL0086]WRQ85627.1 DMT family transporter [Opitutus sp. WL0086]
MFASLLTTVFFSFSAIFATRSIKTIGSTTANLGRLALAMFFLGLYAHLFGIGLGGAGRDWFLLSGVIGMGLGDLALFAALPRLGSRLTVLMCQCIAVPVAMQAEWMWMGTRLTLGQISWAFVILVGVTVALMPSRRDPPKVPVTRLGLLFGFLAAVGQGLGAVVSRHAYEVTTAAGSSIDGVNAAYQRITGGLCITAAYFIIRHLAQRRRETAVTATPPLDRSTRLRGWALILANALCGPTLGVSCYQWALATTPSGIVLPIVATTPLVIIPLSYWIEGDRPSRRSVVGGIIAVAGVVALTLVR